MTLPILWLHEEALRTSHPVFSVAPSDSRAIFIWDDGYFKQCGYSLKRLVFVYETLCALPVEIVQGDTLTILREQLSASSAGDLYVPGSVNPYVHSVISDLSRPTLDGIVKIHTIPDNPFVAISTQPNFKRFFQYWNKAEKCAFVTNGGVD